MKFGSAPIAGAQTFGLPVPPAMLAGIRGNLSAATAGGVVVNAVSTSWFMVSGTQINTVVTTEISDLQASDVDESRLAMPAGYRAGGG